MTREWLLALVVALFAALFIRAFVVEAFRIPTPSMEQSLLVGDFVLVSKLHYGPRAPVTLGIPFTSLYMRNVELPYVRLPGFSSVSRGDVAVFNYPPELVPVDRKTHYIKRIEGLPGDTISIRNKVLHVNGVPGDIIETMQLEYVAQTRDGADLSPVRLASAGASQIGGRVRGRDRLSFVATAATADSIAAWPDVRLVEPLILSADEPRNRAGIFPPGSPYSRDQYGPLYVPARGDTLELNGINLQRYGAVLRRFERVTVDEMPDGTVLINGEPSVSHVFRQGYYFTLGDNRDDSSDSRFWGFVPETHLVGKAVVTYFSWDVDEGRVRMDRLFRWVH
jgi:signal peptidase I